MADLRIVDAPLLSTVKGTEKIPTGGEGNFSVSVNQVADFAKLKWFLATEGYVDNAVGNTQADLNLHKNSVSNPHQVTKAQVGLGNVDNTADLDKPVSNATQSAIITANSGKADKSYVDSQDQLKADKGTVEASLLLKADKVYVDSQLVLKANEVDVDSSLLTKADKTYVDSQDLSLQSQIDQKVEADYVDNALSNLSTVASKFYPTLAQANADIANITVNQVVNIGEVTNGGYWYKATAGATSLTKSPYDPLAQAKADATTKANAAEVNAKTYADKRVAHLAELTLSKTETNPTVIPVLVDNSNKTLIGYDTENDQIFAGGLQEQVLENLSNLMKSTDTAKIAVLTDSNNKILIGYDTENDSAIIAGIELPNQKPLVKAVNHILFYGQSLSLGATATTILSSSQPYNNKTFNTSPRKDSAATSVIPLVEQFNNLSSDGQSNRGETPCSGTANYASRAMQIENGVDPANHVIFASTAGHGSYRIDQLEKGAAWYSFFIEHVSEAKRLNGDNYKVQVVCWVQGENDAATGVQTPYATYRQKLEKLQSDASADIKAITGQTDEVKFITYQMSYAARTWKEQATVQLNLAQQSDKFAMATPIYHMPYTTDNIHLTNVGYKWMGAYFGRAYKQLIVDNRKPDFINPKSAQIINDEIHVKFDVPKLPLVLDTSTLAVTTDNGFKVLVDNVAATISSITVNNNTVILKLSSVPSGVVKVRYALDYLGTGITLTGGASGNLRDSTLDTVTIAGVVKPLYHVCPHFELTAFLDKGI